jgi:peptidoglycan/xylan/chitin deacetylase (PgdA/CDA1 family)
MLNFRSASIALITLAVLVILLVIYHPQLWWIFLPLTGFYFLTLAAGSVFISLNFYLRALCRGIKTEKVVTLTFDDGPDLVITPKVLAVLEKHNIPASFFIIGKKAKKNGALLKQIIRQNHLVGIHSYKHGFFFDFYRKRDMEQDLLKAEDAVTCIAGKKPLLFRPPYGVTNPNLAKAVKNLDFKVIGWSVRSLDTTIKDVEKVSRRIIGKLHPGAVILMHDTQDVTPEAVEKVVIRAKEKGYRFIGLEEMFGIEAYEN